jgi:hypothetical protein
MYITENNYHHFILNELNMALNIENSTVDIN